MKKSILFICSIFMAILVMAGLNTSNIKADELMPGLYDTEDNLIVDWNTIVEEHNLNIEKDYTSSNYNKDNGTDGNAMAYILNLDGMENVVKIVLPDNLTKIGKYAFSHCKNLTNVVMKDGILNIDDYAFYDCNNINAIKIPKSVTNIGKWAFINCYKLKDITFEQDSQLQSIKEKAFASSSTMYLEIPSSVTEISNNAFYNNATILYNGYAGTDEDTFGAKTRIFYIENDWAYYDRAKTKAEYKGKDINIVVPKNITYLVRIPNASIAANIKNITFEEGSQLTTVGANAFSGTYVTKLSLPETLTTIEAGAFATSWLDYLEIPDGVTSIGNNAFRDVFSIKYNGNYGNIDDKWGASYRVHSIENGWAYVNEEKTQVIYMGNEDSITIPKNVIELVKVISNVKDVSFEEGSQLTTIKEGAFRQIGTASKLQSIKLPASLKEIEQLAFYQCSSLTSVIFEKNSQLTTIGDDAFYYNQKLNSIIIPNTVTSINGTNTFYGVKYLGYNGSAGTETDKWGAKYRVYVDGQFLYDSSDKTSIVAYAGDEEIVNIPDNVEIIKSSAFIGNKYIKEIKFSENSKLKKIESNAFQNCENLETMVIPSTVESLGSYILSGTKIKEINLPKNLTTISNYTFANMADLTKIIIESGVNISKNSSFVFQNDTNVKEIIIEDGEENISIPNIFSNISNYVEKIIVGTAAKNGGYSFSNFINLKEVIIKEGNIIIPNSAFYGCSNLEQVVIPASVKTIGQSAFYSNKKLKSIIFDKNSALSEIGKEAFMIPNYAATNAISIEYLELPDSVTTIGSNAFSKKVKYLILDSELNGAFGATKRLFAIDGDWGYANKEKSSGIYLGNNKNIIIPDSIKILANGAFSGADIESIEISNNIEQIDFSAFVDNTIKNLTITNRDNIFTDGEILLLLNNIENIIGYKNSAIEQLVLDINPSIDNSINFITILEDNQVSDINSNIRITDKEINPDIIITVGDNILVKDIDYLISYENIDRPGTGKAIITGINQYTGEVIKEFTIKPEEGVIKKVDSNKNINNLSFENASVNNLITITDADLKQLDNGKNISLFIESDIIEDTPEENSLIIKELTSNESIGVYMDINLYKQIDGEDKIKIEETEEDVTISFEIPENLLKEGREFYIIKVHNGEITKIYPTKIEGNILTFNTKEFSTYALIYKDIADSNQDVISDNNNIINNNVVNSLPNTGVSQPFALLFIGFVNLIGYIIIKKKVLD